MVDSPYPNGCDTSAKKKIFLEEKAIQMAETGSFPDASAIRQRLRAHNYGVLVDEVIQDEGTDFDFTYRLDDMCKRHFRGD